jgi:hypothetical protein
MNYYRPGLAHNGNNQIYASFAEEQLNLFQLEVHQLRLCIVANYGCTLDIPKVLDYYRNSFFHLRFGVVLISLFSSSVELL